MFCVRPWGCARLGRTGSVAVEGQLLAVVAGAAAVAAASGTVSCRSCVTSEWGFEEAVGRDAYVQVESGCRVGFGHTVFEKPEGMCLGEDNGTPGVGWRCEG